MTYARTGLRFGALVCCVVLASCGGSAVQQVTPGTQNQQPGQSGRATLSSTSSSISLPPLGQGYSGKLTVNTISGRGNTLRVEIAPTDTSNGQDAPPPCPTIPLIELQNIGTAPLILTIQSITLNVPCNVGGTEFGMTAFSYIPQPAIEQSQKLGDASGAGTQIVIPSTQQVSIDPGTTKALAVLSEISTREVALPVFPGSTSVLTSNKQPDVPTDLSFFYSSGQGGSRFSTACFKGSPPGMPIVGTPSFYCHIDPGTSPITFGSTVKFTIGAPKFDRSVLGLDGPSKTFLCGLDATSTPCNTPAFTVSNLSSTTTYQNVIVGNVDDLRACVPATPDTDCNRLSSPAPATNSVSKKSDFQLLVADDATYHPAAVPGAVPWDGLFRKLIMSGPCQFSTATDATPDVPPSPTPGSPGYTDSDANQTAAGPYAELDVTPTGKGVCVIQIGEDPNFITDFSDPTNPKGRSVLVTVNIGN